ncbi:MAG: tetratricopeptide repeat protein [Acidobacteriaceae bacterium]
MSFFALKTTPSATDRIGRRRLLFSDTLSLATLFAITALLAVLTNYLYQSYASHQVALAARWLQRGDQALRDNKPQAAVDALSSALAYAPNDRSTAIKLAEALASAGRIQEATVYFNALLESQQGSGVINLQLARLAARQGNESQAIEDFQRAIYGNWEGDGYVRRREVRFELINYLIAHHLLNQARSELLVASGNAPADDISVQLEIARNMELAQDPSDAFHVYRTILHHHPSLREALEGAGRTAFQLGRYLETKLYLTRALELPATEADADESAVAALQQSRDQLSEASRILAVYPSSRLKPGERDARILTARKLAMARLTTCVTAKAAAPATPAAAPAPKVSSNPLQSLASRFTRQPSNPQGKPAAAAPAVDPLQALLERWHKLPSKVTRAQLAKDPELAETQIQLVYDTELVTQQVCGAPTGDDALLLKIAQAPNQVEEE